MEESRLWNTKEHCYPCLRSRLHGSIFLSTISLRECMHLQLPQETLHFTTFCPIYHVPNKSCISGQQASSAIPWISFPGFHQKSTQLHLCLCSIRALDVQMECHGPSPADGQSNHQSGSIREHVVCTANHISLTSGDLKVNVPLLFTISTPTRSSFTQVPNSQALQTFDLNIAPREDVCILQPGLQTLLWAISSSPAPLGHFSKPNLHTVGLNSKSTASSPVKQDPISRNAFWQALKIISLQADMTLYNLRTCTVGGALQTQGVI